jgi:hypothetical protein
MDNQQITLINDNYFAGLIDSDFGVFMTMNTYKGKLSIRPKINFVNTRFELVDACSIKLHSMGINHHVGISKATVGKDSKRIQINRLGKCIEFVDNWCNFSVVRRPQMVLLKKFCCDRTIYVNDYGWKYNNTPYTDDHIDMFHTMCNMNLNYNTDNGNRNHTFSWLAGMIDGDGSIYFSDTFRNTKYTKSSGEIKTYRYRKIIPWIKITTESTTALNNIIDIYEKLNIKYYVESVESKASKKLGKNKKKFLYSIVVKEFDPLLILINKLDGKLLSKQKQLELMKEYIITKKKNRNYSDKLYEIVSKVKKLNNNY